MVSLILLLWACTLPTPSDSAEPPDSVPATDATASLPVLSHEVDIQPIWTATCTDEGCHQQDQGRVMALEAGAAWDNLVNRASSQFPLYDLVEPGLPDGSYLVHKLADTHTTIGGMGRSMPTGKDPLTDEEQLRIRQWIAQGAPP